MRNVVRVCDVTGKEVKGARKNRGQRYDFSEELVRNLDMFVEWALDGTTSPKARKALAYLLRDRARVLDAEAAREQVTDEQAPAAEEPAVVAEDDLV